MVVGSWSSCKQSVAVRLLRTTELLYCLVLQDCLPEVVAWTCMVDILKIRKQHEQLQQLCPCYEMDSDMCCPEITNHKKCNRNWVKICSNCHKLNLSLSSPLQLKNVLEAFHSNTSERRKQTLPCFSKTDSLPVAEVEILLAFTHNKQGRLSASRISCSGLPVVRGRGDGKSCLWQQQCNSQRPPCWASRCGLKSEQSTILHTKKFC